MNIGTLATGPTSEAGKRIVSQNATQHGLTAAADRAIAGEDPAELTAFFQSIHDSLKPVGMAEEMEVDLIAQGYWRLRRVIRFEKAILDHSHKLNAQAAAAIPTPDADTSTPPEPPTADEVIAFSNLARATFAEKQFRHEIHAVKLLQAAIARLHQLRALRHGDPVPVFITQPPSPRRQRRRLQNKPASRLAGLVD